MRVGWIPLMCGILFLFYAAYGCPQASRTLPVIGILTLSAGPDETIIESFRKGLRQFGYVDGHSIRIEHKYAQGQTERLPRLAKELTDLKAQAIVTGAGPQVASGSRGNNGHSHRSRGSRSRPCGLQAYRELSSPRRQCHRNLRPRTGADGEAA